MDGQTNASVSGCLQAGCLPEMAPSPATAMLGEFIPGETLEGGEDVSLEWLSIYVEDCLSGATSYTTSQFTQAPNTTHPQQQTTPQSSKPPPTKNPKPSFQDLAVPARARSKRRRVTPRALSHGRLGAFHVTPSDPLLLHQTYWLADSELIFPKKEKEEEDGEGEEEQAPELAKVGGEKVGKEGSQGPQPRRCTHCLSHKTPQWRAGPLGPKTLCNACGVRFKSGRLLPEYRPAKSPTFVSYKHSNSHKKVMEMRMAILSSPSN